MSSSLSWPYHVIDGPLGGQRLSLPGLMEHLLAFTAPFFGAFFLMKDGSLYRLCIEQTLLHVDDEEEIFDVMSRTEQWFRCDARAVAMQNGR